MIANFLKKISVVSLLLLLMPLHPVTANAVTDSQYRQIQFCYVNATMYELFASLYIKGQTKKQSKNIIKRANTTPAVTKLMMKAVKTTYRDKPSSKFKYALSKLHQCHQAKVPVINQRIGTLCYSLKGMVEVINNSKKSGKTYAQTMAMVDATFKNKTMVSLARTMGKSVYSGDRPISKLQKGYYLTCVKAAAPK